MAHLGTLPARITRASAALGARSAPERRSASSCWAATPAECSRRCVRPRRGTRGIPGGAAGRGGPRRRRFARAWRGLGQPRRERRGRCRGDAGARGACSRPHLTPARRIPDTRRWCQIVKPVDLYPADALGMSCGPKARPIHSLVAGLFQRPMLGGFHPLQGRRRRLVASLLVMSARGADRSRT